MKTLSIYFVLLFTVFYIIVPDPSVLGMTSSSPASSHFTYLCVHASALHLICNSFYLIDFSYRCRTLTPSMWMLAFLIAVLMPPFSDTPVVGISGWLYALSGFIWIFSSNKRYFAILFFVMTAIQLLFANTAVLFHVACFISAIIIGMLLFPVYSTRSKDPVEEDD